MYSTSQIEVVSSLVPTLKEQGYEYYIATTNVTIGYYTEVEPDLYIYFSEEPIIASNGYSYDLPDNTLKYTIRTPNYSSSSTAVNTNRIVVETIEAQTINIDVYEHIYTNAEFNTGAVVQPDICAKGGYQSEKIESVGIVITVLLCVYCIFKMFGNNGSRSRRKYS